MFNFEYSKRKKLKNIYNKALIVIIGLAILIGTGYITSQYLETKRLTEIILKKEEAEKTEQTKEAARLLAIEQKKQEPVNINIPGADTFQALRQDYLKPDSLWILVNKNNPIPTDYIPEGLAIPAVATQANRSLAERSTRADIESFLIELFTAANNDGIKMEILSGYRSAATQAAIFNNSARANGEALANQYIAKPGQSEHQTGLAVDFASIPQVCSLERCFENTIPGEWLKNNAHKYGFILRYPAGKEDITGYQYEPWHFRYVGKDLAKAIYQTNLTLEEVWPYLETARNQLIDNGAI